MFRHLGLSTAVCISLALGWGYVERAFAQQLYWTGGNSFDFIERVNLDGSSPPVTALPPHFYQPGSGHNLNGIAMDPSFKHMYWTDSTTGSIYRANIDVPPGNSPTNIQQIVSGLDTPYGIAIDPTLGRVYWVEEGFIRRADLNSLSITTLVDDADIMSPEGLALDLTTGRMYWSQQSNDKIKSSFIEIPPGETASGRTDIVTLFDNDSGTPSIPLTVSPTGITVDVAARKIYWAESGKIRRANTDGSIPETLVTGISLPHGIALSSGKIYWSEAGDDEIRRSNLNGSSVEQFIGDGNINGETRSPRGIAIDQYPENQSPVPAHPVPNDRLFVANEKFIVKGGGTGVVKQAAFPMPIIAKSCPDGPTVERFPIPIPRFLGETKTTPGEEGLLDDGVRQALLSSIPPMLGPVARLTIMSYDVATGNPGCTGFHLKDPVHFNGQKIGVLQRVPGRWAASTFDIPIADVRFAELKGNYAAGTAPSIPEDANGAPIVSEVDITNNARADCWCTHVGYVMLEFQAMSPVVLIHGSGETNAFWDKKPPVTFSDRLASDQWIWDSQLSIEPDDLDPLNDIIESSDKLADSLPRLLSALGADSFHIVAHSKGGLDSIHYLANHFVEGDDRFLPITWTSLSSPLKGSYLAELRADVIAQGGFELLDVYQNFPNFANFVIPLANSVVGGEATDQLIPENTIGLVESWVELLPQSTAFGTVGSDLDLNTNGKIDAPGVSPDEGLSIRQYLPTINSLLGLLNLPLVNGLANGFFDVLYRTLRDIDSVKISESTCFLFFSCKTIEGISTGGQMLNDIYVTLESSMGPDAFQSLTMSRQAVFIGDRPDSNGNGKSHASVADAEVGSLVTDWMRQLEFDDEINGDMRPFVTVYGAP